MVKKLKKVTDLLLGLFCFALFFVANPNELVKSPALVRTFILNIFLFIPYIFAAYLSYKRSSYFKKILYYFLVGIFSIELILVQAQLLLPSVFDPKGALASTAILSFFVLLALYIFFNYARRS